MITVFKALLEFTAHNVRNSNAHSYQRDIALIILIRLIYYYSVVTEMNPIGIKRS